METTARLLSLLKQEDVDRLLNRLQQHEMREAARYEDFGESIIVVFNTLRVFIKCICNFRTFYYSSPCLSLLIANLYIH